MEKAINIRLLFFIAAFTAAAPIFQGCSSQQAQNIQPSAPAGCIYGTGAGNRCPAPSHGPVDIDGVRGERITGETYSPRGNKDYNVLGQHYVVWRDVQSYEEEGMASWYGPGFHGGKTSNGEHYNMHGFTAAHKNLPLPSFLKVTNLNNGKAVIVRVNDRGPFHGSRILDLSRGAASEIGIIGPGTGKVKIELIRPTLNAMQTSDSVMKGFKPYIQVFATSNRTKAEDIAHNVAAVSGHNVKIDSSNNFYRVKSGPLTESEAPTILAKIKDLGYKNAYFTTD